MSVTYQHVLQLFRDGFGTPVESRPQDPTRILLRIPSLDDAPDIRLPRDGYMTTGIVSPDQLSDVAMQGRRGPVTGQGIVFRNMAENNGAGIWQSAPTDGTAVMIFNASDADHYHAMTDKAAQLERDAHGELTLQALDDVLSFAATIGLTDRYATTASVIESGYINPFLTRDHPVDFPHKQADKTQAVWVPADDGLDWNPNGDVTAHYTASVLIVSKADPATKEPLELRHLNPDDAVAKYQLMDGSRITLADFKSANMTVAISDPVKGARALLPD